MCVSARFTGLSRRENIPSTSRGEVMQRSIYGVVQLAGHSAVNSMVRITLWKIEIHDKLMLARVLNAMKIKKT